MLYPRNEEVSCRKKQKTGEMSLELFPLSSPLRLCDILAVSGCRFSSECSFFSLYRPPSFLCLGWTKMGNEGMGKREPCFIVNCLSCCPFFLPKLSLLPFLIHPSSVYDHFVSQILNNESSINEELYFRELNLIAQIVRRFELLV